MVIKKGFQFQHIIGFGQKKIKILVTMNNVFLLIFILAAKLSDGLNICHVNKTDFCIGISVTTLALELNDVRIQLKSRVNNQLSDSTFKINWKKNNSFYVFDSPKNYSLSQTDGVAVLRRNTPGFIMPNFNIKRGANDSYCLTILKCNRGLMGFCDPYSIYRASDITDIKKGAYLSFRDCVKNDLSQMFVIDPLCKPYCTTEKLQNPYCDQECNYRECFSDNYKCNATWSPTRNPTTTYPTRMKTPKPTAFNGSTPFPTNYPNWKSPSRNPTANPTFNPSVVPTRSPTVMPTFIPTPQPSSWAPTYLPTYISTHHPSYAPSEYEYNRDPYESWYPTHQPSEMPTIVNPSPSPTKGPSAIPSRTPSIIPSHLPTVIPTMNPSYKPTFHPTTTRPSRSPFGGIVMTFSPTISTFRPTSFSVTTAPSISSSQGISTSSPSVATLSEGAKAGIGVSVILFILILCVLLYYYLKKSDSTRPWLKWFKEKPSSSYDDFY